MCATDVIDERLTIFNSPAELNLFDGLSNSDAIDSTESIDVLPILSNANILVRMANVLFYADIMHGDQTVFIGNDGGDTIDASELARMKFEHIKSGYATQWISYDGQTKCTTDADQKISSIERM